MASSVNRTTEIEATLRYHFKTTFAWLWITGFRLQAEHTGQLFADALEMQWPELLDMLKPGIDLVLESASGKSNPSITKFRSGGEFWTKLQQKRCRLYRSAQVSLAGDALSDAGAALFKVGRDGEAVRFCEWGQAVWTISREERAKEEALERGEWYVG